MHPAQEPHHTPEQLAELWGVSPKTIKRLYTPCTKRLVTSQLIEKQGAEMPCALVEVVHSPLILRHFNDFRTPGRDSYAQ